MQESSEEKAKTNEHRVAFELDSDSLAPVYVALRGVLPAEGGPYLVMEYLRGAPLARVFNALHHNKALASDPRLPRLVARIIAGLAEGLHAAPSHVSPQTLYVLFDGSVRVADSGSARAVKLEAIYLAPEQREPGSGDRRSDVWSLGAVAWELLTGRRLPKSKRGFAPASTYRESVSGELDLILMRALERNPNARYQSCRALAQDLERFLHSTPKSVSAQDVAAWMTELFPDGQARIDGMIAAARRLTAPEPSAPDEKEEEEAPELEPRARLGRLAGMLLFGLSLSAIGVASVQFLSGKPLYSFAARPAATGLVNVATPGTSVEVIHRGRLIGKTPISLSLSAGEHELVLRGHGIETRVTVPVTAGEPSSLSLPFPAAVSKVP